MLSSVPQDGRDYGLGVVVGRNIDRGDAARIPVHTLELCEVCDCSVCVCDCVCILYVTSHDNTHS